MKDYIAQNLSKQDTYMLANISNMVAASQKSGQTRFSQFLDERQLALALGRLKMLHCQSYRFFGGADGSVRMMLGVFSDLENSENIRFPIVPLEFSFSSKIKLTHRDFLGALMSQQIERACIGDIIVNEGKAIAFFTEETADFILQSIDKVGKTSVKVSVCENCSIKNEQQYKDIEGTVSSLRLDCIVAFLAGVSRTRAVEIIRGHSIKVNHFETDNLSLAVKPEDVISIKGLGRFIVQKNIKPTKKGRLFVQIKKLL